MPDILHDLPIAIHPDRLFDLLCDPAGLDAWWTQDSEGTPGAGESYRLFFGPGYDWRAVMRRWEPPTEVEWELTQADPDWLGTRVGFRLEPTGNGTQVRFHHAGWREANEHFRISSFCWAMYLRILRRHAELGERVPYGDRLSA